MKLQDNVGASYTTWNGNTLHFKIWRDYETRGTLEYGAAITRIDYGTDRDQRIPSARRAMTLCRTSVEQS